MRGWLPQISRRELSSSAEDLGVLLVLIAPIAVTLIGVLVGATPLTMGLAAGAAIFWQQSWLVSGEEGADALTAALVATLGFSLAVVAVTAASQQL
jgi:hypothetical protein